MPLLLFFKMMNRFFRVELLVIGSHRFGHLALEPESALAMETLQRPVSKSRTFRLWSFGSKKTWSNRELVRAWKRGVHTAPRGFVSALIRAGEIVPSLALHRGTTSIHGPENFLDRTPSHLQNYVVASSSEILRQLGVGAGEPYVCLTIRDSEHYLKHGTPEPESFRLLNFEAETFALMCQFLVDEGYTVVRMGTPTRNALTDLPGVVDYANSGLRSPEHDLVLVRDCEFMVSTQTGPDALALAFRRKVLYVDVLRLSQFFLGTRLAVWNPVKIVCPSSESPLSLNDLLNSKFAWMTSLDSFTASGATVTRSSPLELSELAAGFLEEFRGHVSGDVVELRTQALRMISDELDERGRAKWGEIVAPLNSRWLLKNHHWFLT